ncbi:MAG TPA: hypothetical protein VLF60_00715 [Candidatus Saccharimonadales bacterium]|nr:hypothetical protein [Candidatus Saccharimonadales bacterium]
MEISKFIWKHKEATAAVALAGAAVLSTPSSHHHKNPTAEAGMNFSPEFEKLKAAGQAIGAVAVRCNIVTVKDPAETTLAPNEAKVMGVFTDGAVNRSLQSGILFSANKSGGVTALPLKGGDFKSFSATSLNDEQAFNSGGIHFTVKRDNKIVEVKAGC